MRKTKGYSCCRRPDIHEGDCTFQFVMSRLVEEVADSDDADSFAGKISSQSSRATPEHPRHGVELLAAGLQIGAGYKKVCGRKGRTGGKKRGVLTIPEPMSRGFSWSCRLN